MAKAPLTFPPGSVAALSRASGGN